MSKLSLERNKDMLNRAIRSFFGDGNFVTCSSGLSALQAGLSALGVKAGTYVGCDPLMPYAALATSALGAKPVFYDVDPKLWQIDPKSLPHSVDVVILTSWYGIDPAEEILLKVKHCSIILDRSQCFGPMPTSYWEKILITTHSFQDGKFISCGQGGALITQSQEIATLAKRYLALGWYPRENQEGAIDWQSGWQQRSLGISARLASPIVEYMIKNMQLFHYNAKVRQTAAQFLVERLESEKFEVQPTNSKTYRWMVAIRVTSTVNMKHFTTTLSGKGVNCFTPTHPPVSQWPVFAIDSHVILQQATELLRSLLIINISNMVQAEHTEATIRAYVNSYL